MMARSAVVPVSGPLPEAVDKAGGRPVIWSWFAQRWGPMTAEAGGSSPPRPSGLESKLG